MTIEDRTSPRDGAAARATIASPSAGEPMLIDRLMPAYDALRRAPDRPGRHRDRIRRDSPRRLHPRLARVRRRPAAVRRPRPG